MSRVLMVLNDLADFSRHRVGLAHAARERGHEVVLAAPPGDADACGFPVRTYPLDRRSLGPATALRSLRALRRLYQDEAPDLIHHFTIKPVVLGGEAARGLDAAVVHSVTGLGYAYTRPGPRGALYRTAVRAAYRRAYASGDAMVFQNPHDARQVLGRDRSRAHLVAGSGVDTGHYDAPPLDGQSVVVLPSRLNRNKGVEEFVAAARAVRRTHPELRFALVGTPDPGNPTAVPEADLRAWSDEGVVEWWGWRDDMRSVYADALAVVLPTHGGEGVPKSLLEAAACRRPLVTTDVPGCRELVTPEVGLRVPVRDADALAGAVLHLADDRDAARRMGEAARRRVVDEYDADRAHDALLAVYERVLGTRA